VHVANFDGTAEGSPSAAGVHLLLLLLLLLLLAPEVGVSCVLPAQ